MTRYAQAGIANTDMDNKWSSLFEQLMALGPIDEVTPDVALDRIGMLVDLSWDLDRDDGTARALEWCYALSHQALSDQDTAMLDYFTANAWTNRRRARHRDSDSVWLWDQPELQKQIYHLRRAVQSPGFEAMPNLRRCQILTNLGNHLDHAGRCTAAVATWTRALTIDPHFGVALGNRGHGYIQYAKCLYDPEDRAYFLCFAHKDLSEALSLEASYEGDDSQGAQTFFARHKSEVESVIDIEYARSALRLDGYKLGASRPERHYRQWALRECLFLNPLNDLGAHEVAARDVLSLPAFTTPIGEPPTLIGFFNQMKQEYVSGRWLLYEGLQGGAVHFSDRQVTLLNTLDYPSYSLAVEKMKAAFRIGYSLFDKIAYFLCDYAKLDVDPKQVYFKTIWYEKREPKHGIRQQFSESKNLPLRGLFWLGKDLFDPELHDVMEPDSQALFRIRNQLEHGYLKVHEILLPRAKSPSSEDTWTDRLAYSVSRIDLEAKTLRVFRLAREALLYLAMAISMKERRRQPKEGSLLAMPITLDFWKDSWKR